MKKIILFLLIIVASQMRSQCFQIQSILVDACDGSNEGKNEMVTFQVGSLALNTANLSANWPNNSWLGLCKSAATAASVATLNSTIMGCGFLKEPVAGVLPANAKVLLICSTAFNPSAQSFAGLNDTLYVIFQCAGNTSGHFANFGTGLRSLSMTFTGAGGCTDAVTYDRALLVDQNLVVGGADGSGVEFTASGAATYVNHGCQAPFIPLAVDAGPNKTMCISSVQSFTATTSNAFTSVSWSLGAGATGVFGTPNALSTTYTAGAGDNGTIKLYCTIIKTCGTQSLTAKDSVNVTVRQPAQPVISSTSNSVCAGQSAILSYSLSNASSTGTTSVQWFPGGATTQTISVNTSNIYTVQVNNTCGSSTNTISILSFPTPTVSISANGPTQFCSGGSVILTANSSVPNYLWSDGSTTQTVSVSSSKTLTVTSANSCGSSSDTETVTVLAQPDVIATPNSIPLCAGQSVISTATSSANVTYSWSTGVTTNTVSLNTTGVYTVEASNSCGSAFATVSVTTSSAPTITATTSASLICNSFQTATLTASGSTGNYLWSNGATSSVTTVSNSGVYTVTLTNSCGQDTSSVSVTISSMPTLTLTPQSSMLCPGYTGTLTATSNNTTGFTWSTGAVSTNTILTPTPGSYWVTVSNVCGTKTLTATVGSITMSPIVITPSSYSICPNETATLTATGGILLGFGPSTYAWSNSATTGSVNISNGGVVTLSVTASVCGTYTESINVIVNPISAGIVANPVSGTSPLTVSFVDNSTNATTYLWDFGNGIIANTQTVSSQTYSNVGVYTAYLTVTNGVCMDTDSVIINVLEEGSTLYVPNAFTPNGDSINDVFRVSFTNIKEFNMMIFDRWGLKLHESSDILKGWDGKVNGNVISDGTYYFIINAKDNDNVDIKKQGTVTLFK